MTEVIRVAQIMGYMNGGGVESVVMNYYRHINREKIQFDFIICEGSTLIPRDEIEELGGRVFIVPSYKRIIAYQRAITLLFKSKGWRIVHSHMNSLSVFPLRAAKKAGVPVRIAHSHSTSGDGEYAKNMAKYILKRLSILYPPDRFACGTGAGDWLFGNDCDYAVIPNAIDFRKFYRSDEKRRRLREELGIAKDALVVGHVGRFVRQKNHRFLLGVFREILNRRKDAILLLIGSGPLREEVISLAKEYGVDENVITLGHRDDIGDLYSVFDVFCLPSLYEGLPVVSVECQAAGVPMVMSSAVSEEAYLSELVKFEDLTASLSIWADDILDFAGRINRPLPKLAEYEINRAAAGLMEKYQELYREQNS